MDIKVGGECVVPQVVKHMDNNNPVLISSSSSSSSSSPTPLRRSFPASTNNNKRKYSSSTSSSSAAPPRRLLITSKNNKKDKEIIIDSKCSPQEFLYPRFKSSQPPDPNRPSTCTECNREFKSLRGLYGHMRTHPERPWRGIVPPPDVSSPIPVANNNVGPLAVVNEDVEVATGLLRRSLASHPTAMKVDPGMLVASAQHVNEYSASSSNARFKCSVCKKVFPTYHALRGHRACHKNVKGCFASNYTAADQTERVVETNTCGHLWRQTERDEEQISAQGADVNATSLALHDLVWDLNLPPPPSFVLDQSDGDASSSPDPSLDLHL